MSKSKSSSVAAREENSSPDNDGVSENEAVKPKRMHTIKGIPYPVVRSYYDPKQNVVIDVVEQIKVVRDRNNNAFDVPVYLHRLCDDESIQKRYVRDENAVQEISDV